MPDPDPAPPGEAPIRARPLAEAAIAGAVLLAVAVAVAAGLVKSLPLMATATGLAFVSVVLKFSLIGRAEARPPTSPPPTPEAGPCTDLSPPP